MLTDDEFEKVNALLLNAGAIEDFTISELFGDEWEKLGDGDFRRVFGTRFASDVAKGRFQGVTFRYIRKNGRDNAYSYVPLN